MSATPQHTPGPWVARQRPSGHHAIESSQGELARLCGEANAEADARLLAAAPDLLEALQRLHRLSGQLIDEPSARIAKALASAAITKATNTASK